MTQIHELTIKPSSLSRPKKRRGRGGKRGTYSGRGLKGQKARAGHRIRPAERDLIQRLPKMRGFKNRRLTPSSFILNLRDLERLGLTKVSTAILRKKGLLTSAWRGQIKILGQGEVLRPIKIAPEISVSASAADKITAAGGTIKKTSATSPRKLLQKNLNKF